MLPTRAAAGNARALAETFEDEEARHAMVESAAKFEKILGAPMSKKRG
jgi:hypothetical protein